MTSIRALRLKIQPDDYAWLNAAAREVNAVWNYCNESSQIQAARRRLGENRPLFTGFDLCELTAGYTEYTDCIGADTIQRVAREFPQKLQQAKDRAFEELEREKDPEERAKIRRRIGRLMAGKLRWRASGGPRRALGYVPFKALSISLTDTGVLFAGKRFRVHELERLTELPRPEGARVRPWRDGCFAQDAAGDWYLCVPVRVPDVPAVNLPGVVGIDMGLHDVVCDSDGWRVPAPQFYRASEEKLAELQRPPPGRRKVGKRSRRGKKLTRLHRKVARQRKDFTHKASAKTVKRALKKGNGKIGIGDVSSSSLAQTRMAKSVLDACWNAYRTQVQYKGQQAGIGVYVVSERSSTQECSECHFIAGPKALAGLKTRHWSCSRCGTVHDRDVNSARIHRGRVPLAPADEAGGCHGPEARRPGVRRSRRSAANQRRASVSGNRVPKAAQALHKSEARRAPRCGHEAASETGTAAR